jgi:hypothetical protein
MNVKFWKILVGLLIIDALRYVATARWGMRWLSVQWFDTLYRMSKQTFLHSLVFLYNPALQGNLSQSHYLSLRYTWRKAPGPLRIRSEANHYCVLKIYLACLYKVIRVECDQNFALHWVISSSS